MIVDIYIPSSIISLIYILVKYIVVYKKTYNHTRARREKIMIEKQKLTELVSLFLENYLVYNVWLIWHLCLHTLVVLGIAPITEK